MSRVAPYGSWKSPVTTKLITSSVINLSLAQFSGNSLYWLEGRPQEDGRYVVARRSDDGKAVDVTSAGFNARTRVHEYGGGSYWLHGTTVFFTNFDDQRLYRHDKGKEPRPITPEPAEKAAFRYADGVARNGRILCVRETHKSKKAGDVVNEIVMLPADGSAEPRAIVTGNDFYSSPRVSPDGKRLAWLTWNHPNMPWDGTELWTGSLENGEVTDAKKISGGPGESVFQPEWSPDGVLHFVSDKTGWWNLYAFRDEAESLAPMDAEFGAPQWVFGLSRYTFLSGGRVVCHYTKNGKDCIGIVTPGSKKIRKLDMPYTTLSWGDLRSDGDNRITFIGGGADKALELVLLDVGTSEINVVKKSFSADVGSGYISVPDHVEFPTGGGKTAFAYFYPPANGNFRGPDGEKPPLLVLCHGGPTGGTKPDLRMSCQYWTSRGFAVADVDYGGSAGYGREYRERLRGQWGVVDVADCVNAAKYLAKQGLVNPSRMAIRGGSAGGFTTLLALALHDSFSTGASYYGVTDLVQFVGITHKFEAHYMDGLIGPYPEKKNLYAERSPPTHHERIRQPVIFFQGDEDKIVPPAQSEVMADALKKNGIPVAYILFEGEQHGFRRAKTIERALGAELYFYGRVFGFEPADKTEPVEIENEAALEAGD